MGGQADTCYTITKICRGARHHQQGGVQGPSSQAQGAPRSQDEVRRALQDRQEQVVLPEATILETETSAGQCHLARRLTDLLSVREYAMGRGCHDSALINRLADYDYCKNMCFRCY